MSNSNNNSENRSTGLFTGIAFTVLMILAAALSNDSRLNTRGDFENRLNSGQRIVITSGTYSSGTARVVCFRAPILPWESKEEEIVQYHRSGTSITFIGSRGNAQFSISNQGLTDADNGIWDRKFRGD